MNLLWCLPGQVGGSEEYLVRQLLGMTEFEHRFRITVYVPSGFAQAHPDVAQAYELVEAPGDLTSRPKRVLLENSWLAKKTRSFHMSHHGGGTLPRFTTRRSVLTVHDLQWLTYPQYVSSMKLRYLKATVPNSIRRASIVAVPSEYVRGTVIDATRCGAEKVTVVPHGVEPSIGADATPEDVLRARFNLGDGPVLVYPAITHPHKNHLFLLELLATKWTDPKLRIVMAGGDGLGEKLVDDVIARLGVGDRVVRPGRVGPADRDGLLKMSIGLVFPSEYEGFGAPLIEAMSLGVPVACSDRASLPGVANDAALVRPLTLDAWADVPAQLVAQRNELVVKGFANVARFTSRISGEAAIDAYERCLR